MNVAFLFRTLKVTTKTLCRCLAVIAVVLLGAQTQSHAQSQIVNDTLQPTLQDYNLKGRPFIVTTTHVQDYANDLNYEETLRFNENGCLVEQLMQVRGNTVSTTYPKISTHAQNGSIVRDTVKRTIIERHLDSAGRTITETKSTLKGRLISIHKLFYTFKNDSINQQSTTFFDRQGHIKRVYHFSLAEGITMEERISYDRKGNVKRHCFISYNDDGKTKGTHTNSYQYDKYGNWYSRKYYTNGTLNFTSTRKIQYYTSQQ